MMVLVSGELFQELGRRQVAQRPDRAQEVERLAADARRRTRAWAARTPAGSRASRGRTPVDAREPRERGAGNVSAPAWASRSSRRTTPCTTGSAGQRLGHPRRTPRPGGAPRWRPSAPRRPSCGRWPAPRTAPAAPGRIGFAMVMPASVDRVEHVGADERDRRDQATERHRHDVDRMPASTQSDEVLAAVLAVPEVAGRGDREDRHRAGRRSSRSSRKIAIISTIRGTPCSVNAPETTGHSSSSARWSRRRDLRLDVLVGRERGREAEAMFRSPIGEADVLDEVGRVREAALAGPVVQHPEPRRRRARSGRDRHESAAGLPSRS